MTTTLNTQDIGLSVNDAAEAILGLTDSPEGTPEQQEEVQAETNLDEEVEETESTEDPDDEEDLDEDEDSDEGEDEEDEETEDDSDEVEEYFEVTITTEDGDEVLEVTEEELVNGYLRQSDYTKKRQKESDEFKTKMEELETQIEEYSEGLLDFVTETEIKLLEYQEIDWDSLKAEDPETFNQLYSDALYTEKKYRDAQERLSAIKEESAAKMRQQQEEYLAQQKELVQTLIPEWDQVAGKIKNYLTNEGFEETEINALSNAKIAVLADKARKYDELQTKRETISKNKISKKVPKMVKSGSPTSSGSSKAKATQKAQARLAKTGTIDDAVAVLLSRNS